MAIAVWSSSAFSQSVDVTLHEIHLTVTDRNGRFITDLKPEDFSIYDNDAKQDINTLNQKVESPVSLAVAIDRSASVEDKFPFVVESAAAFVKSVMRQSEDRGFLVGFDSK